MTSQNFNDIFGFTVNAQNANTRARVSIQANCVFCGSRTFIDEPHPCKKREEKLKERHYEEVNDGA